LKLQGHGSIALPLRKLFGWIVDDVSIGQHALMQDARDQNTATFLAIKYDVPPMFHAVQARTNIIAGPA